MNESKEAQEEKLFELDKFIKTLFMRLSNIIDYSRKNIFDTKNLTVKSNTKSNRRDLLTEVDLKVEDFFKMNILNEYPSHFILGEESYDERMNYPLDNLWIIDPIDGTTNFAKQNEDFCTILSYIHAGEPCLSYVYDVRNNILYSSIKGNGVFENDKKLEKPLDKKLEDSIILTDIRRMYLNKPDLFDKLIRKSFAVRSIGSAGLDGMKVVCGKVGGYFNSMAGPWDFSAFHLMAKEQGLFLLNLNQNPLKLTYKDSFFIATPSIYHDLFLNLSSI